MTVTINRLELDSAGLRSEAARSQDSNVTRRLLALAAVMDGKSRAEAAALAGMDRQTLRDWVHRYNEFGIAGLSNGTAPGAKPLLTDTQMAELKAIVVAGPDPEVHQVVRWRRIDLKLVIAERFGVDLHERTVGKLLRRLNLRKISVRPKPPKGDAEAQENFKKNSTTH